MDLGLVGKVALVTGSSRGIGRGIASKLVEEGADVVFCARGAEALDEAVAAATGGGGAHGVVADVATEEGAAAVVDPRRDVDGYLDAARAADLRITHVVETHLHNDYVSGGRELAALTGAQHVIGAGAELRYEHRPLADGDRERHEARQAIGVDPYAHLWDGKPGVRRLGQEEERLSLSVVAELHEEVGLVAPTPLRAARERVAHAVEPFARQGLEGHCPFRRGDRMTPLVPPGTIERPAARQVDARSGIAVIVKEDQPPDRYMLEVGHGEDGENDRHRQRHQPMNQPHSLTLRPERLMLLR